MNIENSCTGANSESYRRCPCELWLPWVFLDDQERSQFPAYDPTYSRRSRACHHLRSWATISNWNSMTLVLRANDGRQLADLFLLVKSSNCWQYLSAERGAVSRPSPKKNERALAERLVPWRSRGVRRDGYESGHHRLVEINPCQWKAFAIECDQRTKPRKCSRRAVSFLGTSQGWLLFLWNCFFLIPCGCRHRMRWNMTIEIRVRSRLNHWETRRDTSVSAWS